MVLKKLVPLFLIMVLTLALAGCGASDEEVADGDTDSETTSEEVDNGEEREESKDYYVAVDPGSSLTIRATPGSTGKTEDDVIERLSEDQAVIIVDKHNNTITEDGYTWWEIYVPASDNQGWAASDFLSAEPGAEPEDEATFNPDNYLGASRSLFMQEFGQPDERIFYPTLEYHYYSELSVVVCYNRLLDKDKIEEIIKY